jgi:hypothetical protein
MDIIAFVADLLTKPHSDLNSLINKTLKILLLFLVSHSIWVLIGGSVTIPSNFSLNLVWYFFASGQIIIPILLIFITSKILKFMIGFVLPFLIMVLYTLISNLFRKMFFYIFSNAPTKSILAYMKSIGLISIRSNKIKKGVFVRFYKAYFSNTDMSKISKEHISAFELFIQILMVWVCLVKFEDFPSIYLYKFIFWSLIGLLVYIPLNLSTFYASRDYTEPFKKLLEAIEKGNNQPNNQNNS